MQPAKRGDKVRVNYTGRSEDGQVFESSVGLVPFMFTIGADEVITGFENAVIGMVPGERKTFVVEPEDGYGMYDEGLVIEIPRESLPGDIDPHVGMDFEVEDDDGNVIPAVVIEIMEQTVIIDANAPLAGKRVIYEVELLEIVRRKSPTSRDSGSPP
ncbi:MAG: peptidylprolyl isomerase [Desulfobacterota bacterium]|jgi:FKBP-type peptidyl-prolyl cis-trans isomerase 2|nr:peptidylprolyl isomerase [Thermodesulfobacteriota bacterium]